MTALDQIVPLYLKACEVEGKTDRTVQSYAETLRHFHTACTQLDMPLEAAAFKAAHVYLFMGWVKDRGVTAGTQHRRQREVKAFFSWCCRMGISRRTRSCGCPWCGVNRKWFSPSRRTTLSSS